MICEAKKEVRQEEKSCFVCKGVGVDVDVEVDVDVSAVSHPRSVWLNTYLTAAGPHGGAAGEVYTALARAGDIAHGAAHSDTQGVLHTHEALARMCKSHLELDRNMHMKEAGYDTALMQILLSELTGKGDLLVGVPKEWITASGDSSLPWAS